MLKRSAIAVVNHIDGRAILEVREAYRDLVGLDCEIDLGVAGSDEARDKGEELFGAIRHALRRRKVLELIEKAKRLAIGSGLTVTVTEA